MKEHPISKYLVSLDGSIVNPKTGYELKPSLSPTGYLKIGNYVCSSGTVHQAVYETYVCLVPKGMQINHIDGVKTNNNLDNLELVTPQENTIHAYKLGLAYGGKGADNPMSKLTDEDIQTMYNMFEIGLCNDCVGGKFSVHTRYVSLVRHGKRWKHLYKGIFTKSNKYECVCRTATTIETIG